MADKFKIGDSVIFLSLEVDISLLFSHHDGKKAIVLEINHAPKPLYKLYFPGDGWTAWVWEEHIYVAEVPPVTSAGDFDFNNLDQVARDLYNNIVLHNWKERDIYLAFMDLKRHVLHSIIDAIK